MLKDGVLGFVVRLSRFELLETTARHIEYPAHSLESKIGISRKTACAASIIDQ
jgi:hypothetical protein